MTNPNRRDPVTLSPPYLQKLSPDKYQVTSELREMVRFNQINLLADQWPFRARHMM